MSMYDLPREEMAAADGLADDFLNAYSASLAEARKRECNHAWPMPVQEDGRIEPDAHCLKGCGGTYELWGGTHR